MSNYRQAVRSRESEQAVANWLAAHGWPHAERVPAFRNGTDVTGVPGWCIEVKAERGWRPTTWLKQHAQAGVPAFVVARPDGYGPERIASWPVVMRLDEFTALLRQAELGEDA